MNLFYEILTDYVKELFFKYLCIEIFQGL